MSPLAERIYEVLRRLPTGSNSPLITYSQLLNQLPRSYHGISPRQPELHLALCEIITACQRQTPPLPVITAMVVSAATEHPGRRYFEAAHPELGIDIEDYDDWEAENAREEVWAIELAKVAITHYPPRLD